MNWLKKIFRRNLLYSDLSQEIREHLEEKVDALLASGMSKDDAIAAARLEFGNALLLEERSREVWRWPAVDVLLAEAKYSIRQLVRNPGFSLTVIAILVLGIGINTAVFSVVDALLLRPLPYPEPDRLAAIVTHATDGKQSDDISRQDGETWQLVRDEVPSLEAAAFKRNSEGVNLQSSNSVRYVQEQRVSAPYFHVLGVAPILGRSFSPEEDRPHGPQVAILSFDLWKSVFAQDQEILGRAIHLKGEPYTVVGVMPSGFKSTSEADVWTPLRPERSREGEGTNYFVVGRLKPGITWAQADAELGRLRPRSFENNVGSQSIQRWLYALPLQKDLAYGGRSALLILMCAVGAVLLIACANLAGLFLVRTMRRGREIATRMALGGSRAAVLRQLLMEPLVLAIVGGGFALFMAAAGLDLLSRLLSTDVILVGSLHLDTRILVFTAGTTVCATVLIALLPALELRRIGLYSSITSGGSSFSQSNKRRTRQILIGAEVALTVVLLAGAGLLIRTLVYLQTLPPGFDANNVMTAQASLNDARYHDGESFQKLLRESIAAMERMPGVEFAAVGLTVPYEQALNNWVKIADGSEKGKGDITNEIYVTPGYFPALRIRLLDGRLSAETDTRESRPVCVVNLRFARRVLGTANALGRHVEAEGAVYEVVGIVSDVAKPAGISDGGPVTTEPIMYIPVTQFSQDAINGYHVWFQPSWIVRTRGPMDGLTAAMQKAFAEVDPLLPFSGFHDMRDFENEALDHQRMTVFLLGALAGLALLLSIIGVYGLVSNLVAQKTREIGIRMALGSTLRRTVIEVGQSGVFAALWGAGAGLALAVVAVRFIQSELYGVRPEDPAAFAITLALVFVAAVLASYIPARRTAAVDPAHILRAE